MGVRASTWAKKQTVGGPTKKVILLVLADRASDADWSTFVGQQTIAKEAEVSTKTVQRALADLEAIGLITRTGRRRRDGYKTSDLIRLNYEWDGSLPPNPQSGEPESGDNQSQDKGSGDNLSPSGDQDIRTGSQATDPQATNCPETSGPTSGDICDQPQATGCPGNRGLTQSSEPPVGTADLQGEHNPSTGDDRPVPPRSRRCPTHEHMTGPVPPCGACADARRTFDAWHRDHAERPPPDPTAGYQQAQRQRVERSTAKVRARASGTPPDPEFNVSQLAEARKRLRLNARKQETA